MELLIPSAEQVRSQLSGLTMKQIAQLSSLSGVPAPTIYKIKLGTTENPGIETLRKFMPHMPAVLAGESEPTPEGA